MKASIFSPGNYLFVVGEICTTTDGPFKVLLIILKNAFCFTKEDINRRKIKMLLKASGASRWNSYTI